MTKSIVNTYEEGKGYSPVARPLRSNYRSDDPDDKMVLTDDLGGEFVKKIVISENGTRMAITMQMADGTATVVNVRIVDSDDSDTDSTLRYKGQWDASGEYAPNDVVSDQNVNYINIQATADNEGVATRPSTGTRSSDFWLVLGQMDIINSFGYQTEQDVADAIAAGMFLSQSQIEALGYQTSQDVTDAINEKGFLTQAQIEGLGFQKAVNVLGLLSTGHYLHYGASWVSTGGFFPGEVVKNGTVNYLCVFHAPPDTEAVSEPGVGSDWSRYWLVLGHQVNNPDAFTGVESRADGFTLMRAGGQHPVDVSLARQASAGRVRFQPSFDGTIDVNPGNFVDSTSVGEVVISGGSGSGASIQRLAVHSSGYVIEIDWSSGGSGYAVGDEIVFTQGGTIAVYELQASDLSNGVLQNFRSKKIYGGKKVGGIEDLIDNSPYTTYLLFANSPTVGAFTWILTGEELHLIHYRDVALTKNDLSDGSFLGKGILVWTSLAGDLLVAGTEAIEDVHVDVLELVGGGTTPTKKVLYESTEAGGSDVTSATSIVEGESFADYDQLLIDISHEDTNGDLSRHDVIVDPNFKREKKIEGLYSHLISILSDTQFSITGTDETNEGLLRIIGYTIFNDEASPVEPVAPKPSILHFTITGAREVPAGTDITGRRYDFDAQVAQAAHASAVRIVGYRGDIVANPASTTVIYTFPRDDFPHLSGDFSIPANTRLAAAGDAYNIRLEVYEEGLVPSSDAPTAYVDNRIVATAVERHVHFGFILSSEGAADIVFADDDVVTGNEVAGTWHTSGVPDTTDTYRNYMVVPSSMTQPTRFYSGGLDASNSWEIPVDMTIDGVDYKVYLVKTLFAATGSVLNGTSWVIQ